MGCECFRARFRPGTPLPADTVHTNKASLQLSTQSDKPTEPSSPSPPSITFSTAHIRALSEPFSACYRPVAKADPAHPHVFRAVFLPTEQVCVIKVFPKPEVLLLSRARRKLKAFVEIVANMDHPNIVRVYEVVEDRDNFYVAGEAMDGGSLTDLLESSQAVSEKKAACLLKQLLSALVYCHNLGIPHKNINLGNLMLKLPPASGLSLALYGFGEKFSVKKTPHKLSCFLAPEVYTQQPTLKSDIWSAGMVLYTLLCGSPPFTPSAYTKLIHRFKKDFLLFPSPKWDAISPSAVSLVSAMLAWDSDARPTAAEAYQHLWLKSMAVTTPPTSRPVRSLLKTLMSTRTGSGLREAVKRFIVFRIKPPTELDGESQRFHALDLDGDGYISKAELLQVLLKIMPEQQAEEEAGAIVKAADLNNNGLIGFEEFVVASYREKDLLTTANLALVFNSIDLDHSGTASIEEMKAVFYFSGTSEKDKIWREMMEIADKDDKREIDFESFCEVIRKTP